MVIIYFLERFDVITGVFRVICILESTVFLRFLRETWARFEPPPDRSGLSGNDPLAATSEMIVQRTNALY